MKLKYLVSFSLLFALIALLWHELFYAKPATVTSALIGKPVPAFELTTLVGPEKKFTEKALSGRVSLLNIWATWCDACQAEHLMLMKIDKQYHVPLYGINYKDDPEEAKKWLNRHGNPYVLVGNDKHGDVIIDLGVDGTPETFVISPEGKIIYRHQGMIDQRVWDQVLYPLIKKYYRFSGNCNGWI